MSGFKDMIQRDIDTVFMNSDEFAERKYISYDGEMYENIPVVMSGLKEKDRRQLVSDHIQGLYLVHAVLHCSAADFPNIHFEKGAKLKIGETRNGYFRSFYIASSVCEMGMHRIELEAVDE